MSFGDFFREVQAPIRKSFIWEAFYKDKKLFEMDLSEHHFDFNEILREATYDLNEDVRFIWTRLEQYVEAYKIHPEMVYNTLKEHGYFLFETIPTTELPSELSQAANKKKPAKIYFGVFKQGSRYNSIKSQIFISLNYKMIVDLGNMGLSLMKNTEPTIKKPIEDEVSYKRVSITIYHELSHWMNDALRNEHIKKYIAKLPYSDPQTQLHQSLFSHIEIEGYIHGIKQMKTFYTDEQWNKMTFNDMMNESNAFKSLIDTIKKINNFNEKLKWKQRFIKRMVRENLLGKSMIPQDLRVS